MKTIVKLLVAVLCACVFTTAHAQYKKVWWDPNQNGMGAFLDQQSNITASGVKQEIIFGAWFHYKTTTDATWLAFSCTLAKESLGRDGCTDVLFTGNGTPPVGYDSKQLRITTVGTMHIVFNSSASATFDFDYTLPGQARQAGTLNWVPQIFGNLLSYTDKVYAIWSNLSYPFSVTKTGVTKVVNKTSFISTTLEYSYINCWLASKPLGDGKVLASCQEDRAGNMRKTLYIDPVKNEMYDYAGVAPTDIVWLVSTSFDPAKPEWSAKTRVSDGWYFTTANITWVLNFQPDTGATITVKAGTFSADGNVKVLVTYTN